MLPGGSIPYLASGLALTVVSLAAARAFGLDARDLALRGPAWSVARHAAVGALVGTAAGAAGVAALRLVAPAIVGGPIEYAPLAIVSGSELLRHVVVFLPLAVALPEEIAFRGALLGMLVRARGTRAGVVLSAVVFALWHGSVAFETVAGTTVSGTGWAALAAAGAFAVVFAGGAVLAALRIRTGTLATTVAAHWSFNAAVLVGLWVTRQP